jgi:hypothetical protein
MKACLWIITAKLSLLYYNSNWITNETEFFNSFHIYIKSLYFATMTMTTVGYGDIHAVNPTEYLASVFIMVSPFSILFRLLRVAYLHIL